MVGSAPQEKSPEFSRKQVASFMGLSLLREHRSVHLSPGECGWVRLQLSSSERVTVAAPFCFESDKTKDKKTDVSVHDNVHDNSLAANIQELA